MQVGLWKGTRAALPSSVKVQGRVVDFAAQISISQVYTLSEDAGEKLYTQAHFNGELISICGMEISVDGKKYIGKPEKSGVMKPAQPYDPHTTSKFTCHLGVLPAHTTLEFKLTYIAQLTPKGFSLCLALPKVYRSDKSSIDMDMELDITMNTWAMKGVATGFNQQLDTAEFSPNHARVALKNENAFSVDEVMIMMEKPQDAVVVMEKDYSSTGYACMVGFSAPILETKHELREVVFILAPPTESAITAVRAAMLQALHILSNGTFFNIFIILESGLYKKLFPESTGVSQQSLEGAVAFVNSQVAVATQLPNLALSLMDIYNSTSLGGDCPRQLILLVGTALTDIATLIPAVQAHAHTTRVSLISIANGRSDSSQSELVQTIARIGRGDVDIVKNDALTEALLRNVEKANSGYWSANVDWGPLEVVHQSPQDASCSKDGEILIWRAFIPIGVPERAQISFQVGGNRVYPTLVDFTKAVEAAGIICRSVAAAANISDTSQDVKRSALGWQYGLVTPNTPLVVSRFLDNGLLEGVVEPAPSFSFLMKKAKRVYSSDFIMKFRGTCTEPPEGLPHISILIKGKGTPNHGYMSPKPKNPVKGHHRHGSGSQATPQKSRERVIRAVQPTGEAYEDIYRKVTGILNKITPEKFPPLSAQLASIKVPNVEVLSGIMRIVFDKAVLEPNFSTMYAELCKLLSEAYPSFAVNGQQQTCRRVILNKCQTEFENRPPKITGEMTAEKEEQELKRRRHMLGNVKFIGELFKLDMLNEKIMHECISRLLIPSSDTGIPDEDDLETLSKLLRTIGQLLESKSATAKANMSECFTQLAALSKNNALSSRIRFMLLDLSELRQCDWVPRRKDNTPQTIAAVHADAEREEQRKAYEREQGMKRPMDKPVGNAKLDPSRRKSIDRRWDQPRSPRMGADANKGKQRNDPEKSPLLKGRKGPDVLRTSFQGTPSAPKEKSALSSSSGSVPRPPTEFSLSMIPEVKDKPLDERALSPEEIETQVDVILEEYYSVMDTTEALTCIRELNTESQPAIIARAINYTLERNKPKEYELLNALLDALVSDGAITPEKLVSGFEAITVYLEDLDIDVPYASKVVADLIGYAIAREQLPFSCVLMLLSSLVSSGKAQTIAAWILQKIYQEVGETKLTEWGGSIDLTQLFKQGKRTTRHLVQFFQDHALGFLAPKDIHNLEELLSLQTATGSWDLDSLAVYFGLDISLLRGSDEEDTESTAKKARQNNSEPVWATCLVLSHLQHEYKDVKSEWDAAADRAREWLHSQQPPARTDSTESLLLVASRFLSEQVE